jgi:hypothetical protein
MKVWWVSALMLCLQGGALAQTPAPRPSGYYVCKDANNHTITSDTPPPECANREIREHGRDGRLRRIIEKPLTTDQRKQREEQAKIKADEEAARAAAKRRDMVLLQTYRNEEALEQARGRSLGDSTAVLKADQERMNVLKKEHALAQSQISEFQKKNPGKPVPFNLQRNADDLTLRIQQQGVLLSRRQEQVARINARFDADKKRWLEIKAEESQGR